MGRPQALFMSPLSNVPPSIPLSHKDPLNPVVAVMSRTAETIQPQFKYTGPAGGCSLPYNDPPTSNMEVRSSGKSPM